MDAEIQRLTTEYLEKVGEHAEAVQVMATWSDGETTRCHVGGVGNWYARMGMAQEFVKTDTARTNAHEIGKVIEPED